MANREELTITSELERIRDARQWLLDCARANGVADGDAWAVELALAEALANVIRHGYGGRPGLQIGIALAIEQDRVEIEVNDNAEPFARETVAIQPLDTPRTGGYGLHLIEEVMDAVEYSGDERGGRLRMVKLRHG